MTLIMIAAADEANGIGFEYEIPWRVPDDLRYFRRRTLGKVVIMGRNTVFTLPATLDGRRIVTLTRTPYETDEFTQNQIVDLLQILDGEVFVAGGEQTYRALMPHCDSAEITRIKGVYRCDAFLPDFPPGEWEMTHTYPLSDNAVIEHWRNNAKSR